MSKPDLRKERPVRFFIGVTVYRLIWWPVVAVHVPFALVGMFVDWLSETAFPAVGNFTAPAFEAARNFAVAAGNLVLGFKPEKLSSILPQTEKGS